MFKWKKLGQVFNPTEIKDRWWMKSHSQCPATIVFKNFVRVYFSCRPDKDVNGQYVSYTTYVDLDKNDLTKVVNISKDPILPLGELGCFDEFGIYPTSVVQKGESVIMYYGGWSRRVSVPFDVAIGCAKSYDNGKTFTRCGTGPVISYSIDEPFVISGPKIRYFNYQWFLYYIAGTKWIKGDSPEIVYKIRMAVSNDRTNWTKINRNIIDNTLEDNECQAGPDVFYHNRKYHMFFSCRYPLDFRNNKDRGYRMGYASSEDLINWTRDDTQSDLTFSESGWDSTMLHYPHVFQCDSDIYMLYNGNEFGKYGFGVAKLYDI